MKNGKKFFDYDAVDHYTIDVKREEIEDLYNRQNQSVTDRLRWNIIVSEMPENSMGTDSLNLLAQIGYSKKAIHESKFEEIDKIFAEKPQEGMMASSCIPVFRDILIFKRNEAITGVAKICFECRRYHIRGTQADVINFGSDKDFLQLGKILREAYNAKV